MTQEERELAEHLKKLGCSLEPVSGYRDVPSRLRWRQKSTPGANQIFDLAQAGAGLVLDMHFSSSMNLPFRVREIIVKAPWGPLDITLLPHPSTVAPQYEVYEFPGEGLSFDKSLVLNDLLSGKRALNPGDEISGLLLAVHPVAIPDNYPEYGRTRLQISIVGTRGNQFTALFKVCFNRGATVARERRRARTKSQSGKAAVPDAA